MSTQERLDQFYRFCGSQITEIQDQLQHLGDVNAQPAERIDAIDSCSRSIARLSNTVRDASSLLPAHDQRTYSEAVKLLSEKLQTTRTALKPRTKFAFKIKKNASASSLADQEALAPHQRIHAPWDANYISGSSSLATTPDRSRSPVLQQPEDTETILTESPAQGIHRPDFASSTSIRIANHKNIHMILPSNCSYATTSTGTLTNLSHSIIDMSAPTSSESHFSSLVLKNISNCLVICGHVNGPAHLTNITESIIVVACRQFRMHESSSVDVYLHVGSRPIIEDCTDLLLAPLPDKYTSENDRRVENRFDQVDDFKWLKAERNPNWCVLDAEKRLGEEVWEKVIDGSTGLDRVGILNSVQVMVGDT